MGKHKIFIGPAGSGGGEPENFERIKTLGLDAVEIAFTYGIWLTREKAANIREANRKLKLRLSIHAPYYINLNAVEKKKTDASKSRILNCCEMGDFLGASEIVFHAGFYLKKSHGETCGIIEKAIKELREIIRNKRWKVILAPETTGKPGQFGSLEELIELRRKTGCGITVDFAHLEARSGGRLDYDGLMGALKSEMPFHSHFSGIEYTSKGERRHLRTRPEDARELLRKMLAHGISTTIINESPAPVDDSVKMKKILGKLA